MGEFSPVQLDALEDALEDLELAGIPSELEADDAVVGRLAEYRELLSLSREAMPTVDVPMGVLDGVLAEAREDAAKPIPARDQAAANEVAPWWKRISLWIPVLAVGASAALVLVMMRGMSDAEPEAATVAQADAAKDDKRADGRARKAEPLLERADELQAVAEPVADADADDGLALGGVETRGRLRGAAMVDEPPAELSKDAEATSPEGGADPAATVEEDPEEEAKPQASPVPDTAQPTDKVLYDDARQRKSGAKSKADAKSSSGSAPSPSKPKKVPAAKPKPAPAPPPEPAASGKGAPGGASKADDAKKKEEVDPLTGAERNRKQGRCGSARMTYNAFVDDADASTRAKALAGLGLCALAEGDSKAADAYFTRAKRADAGISSFIRRERAKVEAKQTKKKQSL